MNVCVHVYIHLDGRVDAWNMYVRVCAFCSEVAQIVTYRGRNHMLATDSSVLISLSLYYGMRKHRMLGRVALAASSWELLRAWLARELSDILGRQSVLGGSRITEAALTGSAGRTLVMDKKWTIMGSRTAPLQEKQMHTSVHYNIQLTHNPRREWRFSKN